MEGLYGLLRLFIREGWLCGNANLDRYDPEKIGIGYILRSDAQSCFNAINANRYLAKDTQYLRRKPVEL